jgi:hypothetical protein
VLAIRDLAASKIRTIPDQSELSSVDLQTGQTLPTVRALHFLHAISLGNYFVPPPFFSLIAAGGGGCLAFFIS